MNTGLLIWQGEVVLVLIIVAILAAVGNSRVEKRKAAESAEKKDEL